MNKASDNYNKEAVINISYCVYCKQGSFWHNERLIFPIRSTVPLPNESMPEDVQADYREASEILVSSPRAAAALLRLGVQKLCMHLGGKGDNLNDDIRQLVKNGLPDTVQKSLDIVRVIGNNAVHPGQIAVDDAEVAVVLFDLVNVIVDRMISIPNRIATIYESLPEDARKNIEKRDGPTPSEPAQ